MRPTLATATAEGIGADVEGCQEQAAGPGEGRPDAAQQRRAERRRNLITLGAIVVVAGAVIAVVIAALPSGGSTSSGASGSQEVIPPTVSGGTPHVQPAALVVPNTSGIRGVVAYDTTGWPSSSHNGSAARALGHTHVPGPVTYSVVPRWAVTTTRPG